MKLLTREQFLFGCVGLLAACGGDDAGSDGSGGSGGSGAGGAGGGSSGGAAGSGGGAAGSGGAAGGSAGSASGGTGGGGGPSCSNDVVAKISNNHGHALSVPMADILAGVEKTYDATGTAQHCHQVTVTAQDFATLKSGGVVTKFSCNGGDHEYVLSCGAAPAPKLPSCGATPSQGSCN